MSKILAVDDSVTNLAILKEYLQKAGGHDVECAFNGVVAKERLQESEYDLLVFDYLMSPINGFVLLTEIRSLGVRTPVLVLSGADAEELKELESQALAAGLGPLAVHHSTKGPPDKLLDAVRDTVGRRT